MCEVDVDHQDQQLASSIKGNILKYK